MGAKQISDPVHGIIPLTELEVRIVSSRGFQRLRNVKQLGLAHYVFPGADYSRFSHSLGACHVMGRILEVLTGTEKGEVLREQRQMYRVAALLHDVGHYPFSHATEYALRDVYSGSLMEAAGAAPQQPKREAILHESVTALVINEDPQIPDLLRDGGIDPALVESTIRRQKPQELLSNLISSDLDADRIDYLLRTAHHAGLPYGSVDIDYLLTQMRLDSSGQVCLTRKAVRAADHMLLCRYFDYQQVTYHKAVAGFEWILKQCVADLVEAGRLDGTKPAIQALVRNGGWADFDDGTLIDLIRKMRDESPDADAKLRSRCILDRAPPVVLAEDERIVQRKDVGEKARYQLYKQALKACVEKFDIPRARLNLWSPGPMTLTKIGGRVEVSDIGKDKTQDGVQQAVRILDERSGDSAPIQGENRSLMSVLANFGVRPLRLYALLTEAERVHLHEMKDVVREIVDGD